MKTRFLTAVVTLALGATMLGGCGKSQEPSPAYEASTGPATYADEVEEEPEPAISVDEPATSSGLTEVTGENDDFGRPDESECVAWEEAEEEAEANQGTDNIEGIIMLTFYPGPSYCMYAIVDAIDPDTASVQNILSLQIPAVKATNEYGYITPLDASRFGNFQDQFSPDFTKMVTTRVKISNQSMHAGWLDENGDFFDVTAAVGEAEASDFDDPVRYQAVGFTDDGATFVYRRVDDYSNYDFKTLGYYAVSVDNMTVGSSWEMSPSDPYLHDDGSWGWLGDFRFSDKVDETHFYADNGDRNNSCVLVDIESQTMTKFIPGETRRNWGAVSSPDGQQIAFMSRPSSGQPDFVELYTMNLADNTTNHVTTISHIEGAHTMSFYSEYDGVNTLCTTIGWR